MAFIDPSELLATAFEPKVSNRFIMDIDGIPGFMVKTAATPNFSSDEVVLDHINTYRKIKGKQRWGDMELTMYDPITPSGAQAVMDWARLSYESVTGRAGYSDFYKKDIRLEQLGPVGDIIGEWIIKGAYVSDANFGSHDWSSSDFISISITVKMDYCILNY
jgi:hypothetical protein